MPPFEYSQELPFSTSLTPTSDNRGIPQRKSFDIVLPKRFSHAKSPSGKPLKFRQVRPLTVNEALQYSPLSSIVPFDSGTIPFVNTDLPTSHSLFINPPARQSIRQTLDHLDRTLQEGHGSSGVIRQTVQDLMSLLNPASGGIPELKFKGQGQLRSPALHTLSSQIPYGLLKSSSHLSPFANMVLNATNVAFRYPTPTSPISPGKKILEPETKIQLNPPPTPETPPTHLRNELAFVKNSQIDVSNVSPQRPRLQPMVMVPPLPPSSDSSQFKIYNGVPSTDGAASRKRKLDQRGDDSFISQAKDQKEISNAALAVLQELIAEILEVEHDVHSEGEQNESSDPNAYYVALKGPDGLTLALSPSTQLQLESRLKKVILLGRFGDVQAGELCKLQKICEVSLMAAESANLALQAGWGSDELSEWHDAINTAEAALLAARTILRIMTGGRDEKQIYSEELLQKVSEIISKIMDSCLIPIVESRTSGSQSNIFEIAMSQKKIVSQLLHRAGKAMQSLLQLLTKVDLTEGTINIVEFFVIRLLFVENAHSEKESVLGTHKFEAFRQTAMNIIAEIFLRYHDQRRFILDEILTSLQKLPTIRQHARQFKLGDGKSMQLVSALLMRLVQTSGMSSNQKAAKRNKRALPDYDDGEHMSLENSSDEESSPRYSDDETNSVGETSIDNHESRKSCKGAHLPSRTVSDVKSLYDSAVANAQYIVNFFATRASSASKSGDQPHRNLIDMFAEDLYSVLGLPEWPASELLLRALLTKMDDIVGSDKSTAPAKSMALEMLGGMGSAISEVTAGARQLARNLENDDSDLSSRLIQYLGDQLTGMLEDRELLGWTGPYRAVMEYLGAMGTDLQNVSAQGYCLTQWAKLWLWGNRPTAEKVEGLRNDERNTELAANLERMLAGGRLFNTENFDPVSASQCRLAYILTILNVGFCRAFGHILKVLLESVSSDQVTIRTRSLKSVTQMLEKDPSLLDRMPHVIRLILKCSSDLSPMVRDSALGLIGKCINLKPALELEVLKSILTCTTDSAVGVRKRSMKLLKDIYLRNLHQDVRTAIADSLFQRARDFDNGVAELASQMFEEVWLAPYWTRPNEEELSAQNRVSLKEHVTLITKTVQRGESVVTVLQTLLRQLLSAKSKNGDSNFRVCKAIVASAFEDIIDGPDLPGQLTQQNLLRTLTVFARASPTLVTQQQLLHLQPYITSLATSDDLNIFRSVVVILRNVLPTLSAVQKDFLKRIQDDLFKNVTKLAKAELNEVIACLWAINGELHNIERLVKAQLSVLKSLRNLESLDYTQSDRQQELSKVKRFLLLAGHFAKHCNFQTQLPQFKSSLPWCIGDSASACVIECIAPFTSHRHPLGLRTIAYDSIGMICQVWPRNFNHSTTARDFGQVLNSDHSDLQSIVLSSFRDFFATQDRKFEANTVSDEKDPLAQGKLGGSMTADDTDGAAALIAQRFLGDILKIALSSQDTYALTAVEVVASIARQGLVHPKECGPALIALETSPNTRIAQIAFEQHQALHQQHESVLEREYMPALRTAFLYQRDIIQDSTGFTSQPYRAKLHSLYEVIRTSRPKYQLKFLSNFCGKLAFEVTKLEISEKPLSHVQYSRFLIGNLAFFEYGRIEDVLHVTSCMERLVHSIGAGIAHSINTDIFDVTLENVAQRSNKPSDVTLAVEGAPIKDIEDDWFLQLATASIILSMLWEARNFICRLYGIEASQQHRENKSKAVSKDLNKAPTKVRSITGDRFVEMMAKLSRALESRDFMLIQCREFAELLAIDNEFKVPADTDGEDNFDSRLHTPGAEDDPQMPISAGPKNGKRKSFASLAGTPHKKKKGRPVLGERRRSRKSVDDEEDSY